MHPSRGQGREMPTFSSRMLKATRFRYGSPDMCNLLSQDAAQVAIKRQATSDNHTGASLPQTDSPAVHTEALGLASANDAQETQLIKWVARSVVFARIS